MSVAINLKNNTSKRVKTPSNKSASGWNRNFTNDRGLSTTSPDTLKPFDPCDHQLAKKFKRKQNILRNYDINKY